MVSLFNTCSTLKFPRPARNLAEVTSVRHHAPRPAFELLETKTLSSRRPGISEYANEEVGMQMEKNEQVIDSD